MMVDGLLGDGRRPVVVALMSVIAIASYNNLSAAAALPDIGDDLGDIELLPWVITLELLTSAVAVLAAGPVVDGLGARRVFRIAVVGFALTSIAVAAAPSMVVLLAARGVQGAFAGAIMTVGVASIGLAIPAALRGIFVVNVPVTIIAASIGWHRIPDRQEGAARQRVDRVGLMLIAAITTAVLSLASYDTTIMAVAGAVLAVSVPVYIRWSRRTADPVVRLPHLVQDRYRTVHLTSMAVLAGGVGANSFLPLYLRTTRGQSAGLAAFSVLFLTVGWSVSAYISSRLQERWAGEWVTLLGSVIATPGVVVAAICIQTEAPVGAVYAAFYWIGSGVGMVTSTGAALLQSRTAAAEMGRLNAAHQFLRTLSITFGIAAVGAVTLATVDSRTGDVERVRELLSGDDVRIAADVLGAISDGYAIAVAVMGIVVAASIPSAVRLVRTRSQALASAT